MWLVEDRLADNAVMVLKRLNTRAQAGLAQWLVNEFQILAQLDLPTVARVFDFGLASADEEDPGGAFFTRAFVDGVPLDEALAKGSGTLDAAKVTKFIVSAAETLRELHRLGVVHGDLKPANIIVPRETDHAVLIDFGLAQGSLGAAPEVRGGTLGFMPPERQAALLAGEALEPDPRADVYALAVTLRCVLSGENDPPRGENTAPQWVTENQDLSALWKLAVRGSSDDPSRRFATMDDLLVALGTQDPRSLRPAALTGRIVLRPEGRESELGVLLDAVARRLVRHETSAPVVLVHGAEGSGRSTLLRELSWRAQLRGVQTLWVPGAPGEGPARKLREGAAILSARAELSGPVENVTEAFREAAKTAPVLVLADDLDLADRGVAALLRSIAYGCEPAEPLLVIATAQEPMTVSGLDPALTVSLGPLELSSVESLCTQILGAVEPAVSAAVHRRSGGLTLAVTELLMALARDGAVSPADVDRVEVSARARDVAVRRVMALGESARDAAVIVAALGSEATSDRVTSLVASRTPLDLARAAGVLTQHPDGRWALSHSAIETVLFDSFDFATRQEIFRRVASVLDATGATVTARATAWLRAGEPSRAAALRDDTVTALRREGLTVAAAGFVSALRQAGHDDGVVGLLQETELLHEGGLMSEAMALAERAERVAVSGLDVHRAKLLRARLMRGAGELSRAEALLQTVTQDLGAQSETSEERELVAESLVESARAAMARGDYSEVQRRCSDALGLATTVTSRAGANAVGGLGAVYMGDAVKGSAMLEAAREEYAAKGLAREEATLLAYLAIGREKSGDLDGARGLHERALERARAAGDLRAMVTARINLGHIAQRVGDLGAALEHNQAALRLALRAGLKPAVLHARINTASELLRIGSLDRARADIEAALELAKETGARDIVGAATLMLGVALSRGGQVDRGLELVTEAVGLFSALGQSDDVVDALFDAAEVHLDRGAEGDVDSAAAALGKARELERDGDALGLRGARAKVLDARVLLAQGEVRRALALVTEVIDADSAHTDWEAYAQAFSVRARCHAATGAELHGRRDTERAIEVLEAKASQLPPDLRSAFWSVPRRASLRGEVLTASEPAGGVAPRVDAAPLRRVTMAGRAGATVNAPTLIATDERLLLLVELSKRMGEETSLERVLEQAVRSAMELTNAERGAVLLPAERGGLEVRVRSGAFRGDGPDETFSRTIAETVWIDAEPVVTVDAQGDRRFAEYRSVHELGLTAVVAVPLLFRGRALGVLLVESRRRRVAWAASDVALMLAFGEQAATAVEHARLVEELEARTRELEAARSSLVALLESRTHELEATRSSLVRAQEALGKRFAPAGIIGQTTAMRKLYAVLERVRDSDVSVVIEGESGTGKELVARALHFSGVRAKGPFIVVNCGAMPETLMESELFGHVKGAFTGADRDRKGLIAAADGGTLMLDEVSEMSPRMQVELLRVLQDRRVRPVGGERDEVVDVRVVAATHRPLLELVRDGLFREDLYYRLAVVTMAIPALRARSEDIPALATHFLSSFADDNGTARKRLSREALSRLLRFRWPGNVRQLRHALENAVVMTEGEVIEAEALPLPPEPGSEGAKATLQNTSPGASGATVLAVRKASEKQRIIDALEQVNWNKVRAAEVLSMPRRTLYRRLKEYGLME